MVSCAAFRCNNRGTKGNGPSFFSFPKDGQLRKAWIHYCQRWNFDPTSGHRLCSTHFTRDCFERDPLRMMELGVDGTFKRRLKPDATPNVLLASPDPEKKKWRNSSCSTPTHSQGSTTEASKGRGLRVVSNDMTHIKAERLGIAALHYNENCNRNQATTKDGQQCFNTCYPKKGTHVVAKPRRTPPPSFVYVALIKQAVVKRRRSECSTHSNALDDVKVLITTNPPSLTSSFTIFEKADLIQRHRSRFSRQ